MVCGKAGSYFVSLVARTLVISGSEFCRRPVYCGSGKIGAELVQQKSGCGLGAAFASCVETSSIEKSMPKSRGKNVEATIILNILVLDQFFRRRRAKLRKRIASADEH